MTKAALITGGASGMGLHVARALCERGGWNVHLVDLNEAAGSKISESLPGATFHHANVADYGQLSAAFKAAFVTEGNRLDFVFANAGCIEKKSFYARHEGIDPPPEPDQSSIDVDVKGVVSTSYLALHYFRQSPHQGQGANLIITASCGGFYPSYYSPMYTAAKHGAVGFLRSIAGHFRLDGIRANAICPGIVETNLVGEGGWSNFPQHLFTPIDMIAKVVLLLLDGAELSDANGHVVSAQSTHGLTVEINLNNYYVRTQPEFCDDAMKTIMMATSVENQIGGVLRE